MTTVPGLVFGRIGTSARAGAPYVVETCAEKPGILCTPGDFDLSVRHGLEAITRADTVVVPSWDPTVELSQPIRLALRRAHRRGARIAGLCLGSWAVAATGLADGRELTTHWSAAEALARAFPWAAFRAG